MKLLQTGFFILLVAIATSQTIQVFSASTFLTTPSTSLSGSLRGGRMIYIQGVGFPSDPSLIQVQVGIYDCKIPADGATSVAITCETADTFSLVDIKSLPIRVICQGQVYTVPSTTYSYQDSDTPSVNDIFPSTSVPGTRLNVYGTHRVLNTGDGLRDMGDFVGLYIGGNTCSMFDINQDQLSYNSFGRAQCNQTPLQQAGLYNFTERVVAGWAKKIYTMRKPSLTNINYEHTVLPSITQLNTISGYNSGQDLTIGGLGFSNNPSKIEVKIDNTICDVTKSTLTTINCRLRPKSANTSQLQTNTTNQTNGFIGGAGFDYKRYDISSLSSISLANFRNALQSGISMTLVQSGKRMELETPNIYGQKYGQVFKGYFYAPVSGYYTFRGAGDDQFILLLNPNYGSSNGVLNTIISTSSAGSSVDNYYISNISSTFGSPINMQAGKYYYVEVYHINGIGAGFLKISVQVPNTDLTLAKQLFEVNHFETTFVNGPQILSFTLDKANGGTFNLSFTRKNPSTLQVTYYREVTIPHSASVSQFGSFINQFDSYSGASTTCTSANAYDASGNVVALTSSSKVKTVWTVSIVRLRTNAQLAQRFTFKSTNLVSVGGTPTFVQTTITAHSPLISGTFTMDIGGQSIKLYDSVSRTYSIFNIPYNVASSALQTALRQIVGFQQVQVFRSGSPDYGAKWLISYLEYNMDVPDIILSASSLAGGVTGTSPQIGFYETRKWSSNILFNPVNQVFLYQAVETANVLVKVNQLMAACNRANCVYSFQNDDFAITTQARNSLGVLISVTVSNTINENYPTSDLTVKVDGQLCTITTGTFTSFTCSLPTNTDGTPKIKAGSYNVQVFLAGKGILSLSPNISTILYDLQLTSLSRSSGAIYGGYLITINGLGFPNDPSLVTIRLCGSTLKITQINNIQTTVIAPECSAGLNTINYIYNGFNKTIPYTFTTPTMPASLVSVSPRAASPVKKGLLTITGTGFGTNIASDITVYLANSTGKIYNLRVISVNNTMIVCGLPGGNAGRYSVKVTINNLGDIPVNTASADQFQYKLSISSISPRTGGYYGGTLLTITGEVFSTDLLQNIVTVGYQLNTICRIQAVNQTQIKCRMPPANTYWSGLTQDVIVTNRIIADSNCPNDNCDFTYASLASSPKITSLNFASTTSGLGNLIITGSGLDITNFTNVKVVLENQLTKAITVVNVNNVNSTNVNFTVPNVQGGSYWARIRLDPFGQTNSLRLNLTTSLNSSTSPSGSIKGGSVILTGYGLPSVWPNYLWTLVVTLNSIPLTVKVITTSTQKIQIQILQGINGNSYSISLTNPNFQAVTRTYTQSTSSTPTLQITTTLPLSSGLRSINLNRTLSALNTKPVSSISIFNKLDSKKLYPVTNWTYSGSTITFSYDFPAGSYGIKVWVPGYGWASCSQFINVVANDTYNATSAQSSIVGGVLTISGFAISPDSIIKVGGFVGKAIQVSAGSATFNIPPLITANTVSQYPQIAKQQTIYPANIISDGGSNPGAAFDNVHPSFYSSTNSICFIGLDLGQGKLVDIKRIRYFPYYKWTIAAKYIKGAVIEGSLDGVNYNSITVIDQTVHAGWNSIKIISNSVYRYVRLRHTTLSGCKLSEFQVNGIILNNLNPSNINDFTTDAIFNDGYNTYTFTNAIRYLSTATPRVVLISPNKGTIYGGTIITFTGSNFDAGTPNVVIDGITCNVNSSSLTSSYFTCMTGQRLSLPQQNSFTVRFGNQNSLLNDQFLYVMRWSDIRTWGTDLPPVEGDLVYVPKGMSLYVDQSTPRLDGIVVQDGKLIFADQSDMEIHTNLITINRGQFRAGTQDKPYQNKLTFIMYGSYYGKQQPMFGNKGIGCRECKFSMYGKPRNKTWTMIADTIYPGNTTFNVIDTVDWQIGERIVIASTDFDHNQAQPRTITNIVGTQITVNESFVYKHFGGIENYGSDQIQMRAQVGLLTRNIKMMGDPSSAQGQYGSHLMLAGTAENGLVGHIAYTQFTHCGQPRIVGRYCMHFHMNGDVIDSYAVGNAVHQSFARVITIHGVRYLRVADNVGYRVKGHNFFIEDGIQTDNLLENNLAISSLQSWNMMQTDISVASFWVTNPTNHLRNNHAAGGDFYGFWYEIKPNPDGPSSTIDVCPIGNPLGQSHDNVAHSYKRFGLRIFKLYSRQIPCNPIRDDSAVDPWAANPSIQSRFYNYVLYKNGESGLLAEQTGNTIFQNFTVAENRLAGIQFYRTNLTREAVIARDIVIIGATSNNTTPDLSLLSKARGVIAPRTNGFKMSNIRFINFISNTFILQTCAQCDQFLLYTNAAHQYFLDTISYQNINGGYLIMKGLKRSIIYDTDGSFSARFDAVNRTSATIVGNYKHIAAQPNCEPANTPALWDNALTCDQTITIRRVMFTNLIKQSIFSQFPMKVQLIADQSQIVANDSTSYTQFYSLIGKMEPKKDKPKSYSLPYVVDRVYNAWWSTGLDFTHLAMDISQSFLDSDPAIVFKFNYTQNRQLYEIGHLINTRITGSYITPLVNGTLDRDTCSFGDYTHDVTNKVLTICASSRNKIQPFQYLDINGIKCRYLCPSPAGQFVKESFIRIWSNVTQWPNRTMPVSGQNITIPGEWTIIMDISPAQMGFWLVDGDVIIDPNLAQANIKAESIWVRAGSIQAGTSTTPFPGKINIQIYGNKDDRGFVLSPDIAGTKLFVVHGKLNFYGVVPTSTWGRATSTVRQGSTSIIITAALTGWNIGDQIVIGPTFNSPSEHELVTITDINTQTKTITFTPALNFTHYGSSSVTVNNTIGTLDARAAVGLLTRNIRIYSGADQGWGFQTIINGYNDGVRIRSGSVTLQGVQFFNGGQYDTQNTPIKLWNTIGTDDITITKCSFHQCKAHCMDINNINNALVTNNVFYNGRLLHVRALQLNSFKFSSNLMISAISRPTMSSAAQQLVACYLTHDPIHEKDVSITSNLCQGSDMHGFAFPYIPCSSLSTPPYSDNTAGSMKVGFIFGAIQTSCKAASGIKAYACGIGQITSAPGTDSVMFQKFMIVDSGRGATLRFGKQGDDRSAYFSNSYISAISRPTCSECYGPTAIDCSNNFALRMLAVTVNGQRLPNKFGPGFDVICRQEVFDSKAFLENIIFQNYNQVYPNLTQCSKNVIFKPHDTASDMTASHHLKNVVCNGCSLNAMAQFTPPNPAFLGWFGGCGKILCTGKNNYLIHDHTGDLLGSPSILLANNSQIGDKTEGCTFITEINGHHCLRTDLAVLQYENIAPDFDTRIMWPVYLKFDGGLWNTTTNGWRQWQWQGNQPLNRRLGRFVSVIQLYQTYNMTFESMPPIDMRLQIQQRSTTGNPQDWLIVKLRYPLPNSIRVQNRFGIVRPIRLLPNNSQGPLNTSICGSNKYFYDNYTVHFVITAEKTCQVRVSITNSIQLNARISMDINSFFSSDGQTKFIDRMCAVLGITDTSRFKIVSINQGSVEITSVIDQIQSTTTQNSTSANDTANAEQLARIKELITVKNNDGSLGAALTSAGLGPLLNLQATIYYHHNNNNNDNGGQDVPQDLTPQQEQKKNTISIGLIIGVVLGSTVMVALVFSGGIYMVRKRAKISQLQQNQESDEQKIHMQTAQQNETVLAFQSSKLRKR